MARSSNQAQPRQRGLTPQLLMKSLPCDGVVRAQVGPRDEIVATNDPTGKHRDLLSRFVRSLRPAAFHESGHAVANIALGIRFCSVKIRSDGGGEVVGTGEMQSLSHQEVENKIVATLAGPYAEARLSRRSCVAIMLSSGEEDYRKVTEMLEWLVYRMRYIPDMREAERRFSEYTTEWLRDRWPSVERVANALIQHRELTPSAVAALAGLPEVRR